MANETIESEAIYFPVTTVEQATEAAGGYASAEGAAVHEPGPAVRVNDELLVTVPEVEAWPEDVLGKSITVKGRVHVADGVVSMEKILYEVAGE